MGMVVTAGHASPTSTHVHVAQVRRAGLDLKLRCAGAGTSALRKSSPNNWTDTSQSPQGMTDNVNVALVLPTLGARDSSATARGSTERVEAIVRSAHTPPFEEGLCGLVTDPRPASVDLADLDVVLLGDACAMVEVLDAGQQAQLAAGAPGCTVSRAISYGGPLVAANAAPIVPPVVVPVVAPRARAVVVIRLVDHPVDVHD